MDRSIRIAVEETAEFVLELADARTRLADQQPGKLLIVQPRAALDGVHEVTLDGIARRQRHVVTALHHARAAAFPEQALHGDGDVEIGICALGVQRGEEASAPSPEYEDIGIEPVHCERGHFNASMRARTSSRREAAAALMSRWSEPPCESIVTSSGPKPWMRNFHKHSGLSSSKSTSSIASIQ